MRRRHRARPCRRTRRITRTIYVKDCEECSKYEELREVNRLEIKTITQFKKLTTDEKLAYVLGEADHTGTKLLALWIADIEKKIQKEG